MSSVLIKNGLIYDGSGEKPYSGSVLVKDNVISRILKDGETAEADTVIDAHGMMITPGFIDIHRHCDIKPFNSKTMVM